MTQDRDLIATINSHFARKSSAQLQEIVQAKNHDRWSPEALVAAGEVLQDRLAGRAQEPRGAEGEPPLGSAPDSYAPYTLAFWAQYALGFLSGGWPVEAVFFHRFENTDGSDPDLPVPFGPKMAWLAL